ncbi:hypothetical protein HaLaN_14936, partial [Haematococcus lacustris]
MQSTTGLQFMFTLQRFRADPSTINTYYFPTFLKDLLIFVLVFLMFSYVTLALYYSLRGGREVSGWRQVIRTLYWAY